MCLLIIGILAYLVPMYVNNVGIGVEQDNKYKIYFELFHNTIQANRTHTYF